MNKDSKKILLVSNGFLPEISPRSYRATELAKEFCRQGHEVTVISKYRDFNYSKFLAEYPITFRMWGRSRFPKIPVSQNRFLSYIGRGLNRLLSLLFEYPEIESMFKVRRILKDKKGYDLLISFAVPYPVHWGVALARKQSNPIAKLWIADCGDPFMGDVLDSFKKLFYFKYIEKWSFRKAEFITIPIESAKEGYYKEFHPRIRIIPQGFDFDLNNKVKRVPSNEVPTFAYSGGFLPGARDPGPLLEFLSGIDIDFKFIIYSNSTEMVNGYKSALGEKLQVMNYIPREELMNVLAEMDFLINFDNNTNLNSPSKLIDYTIVGRPVLNITRDFNERDLLAFLKGDYSNRLKLPKPDYYHINRIAGLFLKLINEKSVHE